MGMKTHATAGRRTVPVTAEDARTAERIKDGSLAERQALAALGVELSGNPSTGEVMSALITLGRVAVQEKVAESGYAAWAASIDTDDQAYWQAARKQSARYGHRFPEDEAA